MKLWALMFGIIVIIFMFREDPTPFQAVVSLGLFIIAFNTTDWERKK
jgi:hypothetical protein